MTSSSGSRSGSPVTKGSVVSTSRACRKRLLELVAQRGAEIVALGLERHAEQADRHRAEIVAAAQVVDDVQRQTFVDHDRRVAER